MEKISCGHETEDNKLMLVAVKNKEKNGERSVRYLKVCSKCYANYMQNDAILYDYKEREKWLKDK